MGTGEGTCISGRGSGRGEGGANKRENGDIGGEEEAETEDSRKAVKRRRSEVRPSRKLPVGTREA